MSARSNHAALASLLDGIACSVAMLGKGPSGQFCYTAANDRYEALSQRPSTEIIGLTLHEVLGREPAVQIAAKLQSAVDTGETTECEFTLDGRDVLHSWRVTLSPLIEDGNIVNVLKTAVDISERTKLTRELEAARLRLQAIFASSHDGILTVDEQQRITLFNPAALKMFQIDAAQVLGRPLSVLLPERFHLTHKELVEVFRSSEQGSRPMHSRPIVVGKRGDGSEFQAEVAISQVRIRNTVEMTAVIRDVSERSKMLHELRQLATTDPLTGLANRRTMIRWLDDEIARSSRFERPMSLVMLDIDHFKRVNDTYGHLVGDAVLQHVAVLTQRCIRGIDKIARLGGEEFLLLLPETRIEQAIEVAERVRRSIESSPVEVEGGLTFTITASFGAAQHGGTIASRDDLLASADSALYEAKETGRNRVASSTGRRMPRATGSAAIVADPTAEP